MSAKTDLEAELRNIETSYGRYTYDMALSEGISTLRTADLERLPHTRLKRIVQTISDLCPVPLASCRILDLGCLDGLFAIEFAAQGATVIGIDIRENNIARANFAASKIGVKGLTFMMEDVRNISAERYGMFDAIICSGLLYHLDFPDIPQLVATMYSMCRHLCVIDTHISLTPVKSVEYGGRIFYGHEYREHKQSDSEGVKLNRGLASFGNDQSFSLSRPSLINLLSGAGFSSVYECFNPAHINFGQPGLEHRDRCTFVCLRRPQVSLRMSPNANALDEQWPEGTLQYAAPIREERGLRTKVKRLVRPLGLRFGSSI